jgi:RNA polymerase sigma-70 factor, ECF subfamily
MRASAFDSCFREHFARIVALGVSMTGDREVARDLAQETFLRLHRRWDAVETYDNIAAWLTRVMSNLAIDHHRSKVSALRTAERVASLPVAPHVGVGDGDGGETWADLVGALPPRQRVIVTLYYAADLSVADIAATLDVSPNTVKSALAKARDALRSGWEGVSA